MERSEFIESERDRLLVDLRNLKPGLHLLVTHPSLYPPGQAREMREIILAPQVKQIIRDRGVRLVSYQDVWNRKFGKPEADSH